jgi:flagellar basal-body rod protein FlgC
MGTFLAGFEVAASGLQAHRTRLNVITSNLANSETTRTAEGGPYRRLQATLQTADVPGHGFGREWSRAVSGVRVSGVVEDQDAPLRRVHDPAHPDADAEGFVDLPNVEVLREMVDMMVASRSYEANAAAFETLKGMAMRAIQIGQ